MGPELYPLVDEATRHWPLDGTYNLRDLGGYPAGQGGHTRWNTLLRSDGLHRLPTESQQTLIDFGLRTVIDLRTEAETATAPNVFATSDCVAYVHLPMLAPHIIDQHRAETLDELYKILVEECQNQIAYAVSVLADHGGVPAIIHCSAGKDRTGVVVAVLLDLLGVDREIIVDNYLQTKAYMRSIKSELRSAAAQIGYDLDRLDRMLECEAEAIKGALAYIDDSFGGSAGYVTAAGTEESALARLRMALVEDV